ncbi:phage major capsid protein [Rhodanobacter denitrificans]|uniref:Phage capsid family protein n=1 Tax=Rhodanobacter denitrificans TaxID=666685 RepID=M4NDD1_9GAMM|nr:phage major capsid protein [Rhodanobacter denitrificans]AGG88760.1 phage capsid family protein [Rhodanobacter denitrificans]UJJ58573.1 phage major capsid protein [Rhodanobacter denitrificans]UJM87892.1 phage major capsid protein [Rhodanobacter denitrificans]
MNNHSILRTLKPGQRLQTKAADGDPLLAAVAEHAQRFEKAAEKSALEIKALKDANAEQAETLNGMVQELAEIKSFRGHGGGGGNAGPSPVRSFIESDGLKSFLGGQNSTGRIELKNSSVKMLCKAVVNTGRGGVGDQSYTAPNDRDSNNLWGFAVRPLTLMEALRAIPVTSGSYEFTQLDPSYSNAADYQATEGAEKAEGGFPTVDAVATIATIAHWIPVSNQVLADAPSLEVQIDNLLRVGVFQRAENQVLNGVGGTGKIKGIIPQATAFAATADDAQDRIGEAVTALAAAGWAGQPAIIMNPVDWGNITRTRGTSEGTYLLGSPVAPAPPVLWNTPVIQSASVPAGTTVVADLSQMALLDRQQVTVQASREQKFTSNVTILLGEGRLGLAVFSPGAVLKVALVPTT